MLINIVVAVTQQQLRDIFYDILREEEDVTAYPLSFADQLLDASQLRICTGRVKNPLTQVEARKGVLPFLNSEVFYANIPSVYLSADLTVGATTIIVGSTENYPTAGKLYIAGNIVEYTGTTSNTFTGVTGVIYPFKAGIEVSIVNDLPTDYASSINVIYNDKMRLDAQAFDKVFENLNDYKGTYHQRARSSDTYYNKRRVPPFYTLKDRKYLLVYNLNDVQGFVKLRYETLPPAMSDSQGPIIDIDTYAKSTIPYLAVGEMLYNRGEEGRAADIFNFVIGQVQEMYDYYNNSDFEKVSGVNYKMGKGKMNIG